MTKVFRIADLFCGAGGSSTGAVRAIQAMGGEIDLVAVNHWNVAIATHSRNHPHARHYCVNLDAARPEELVPEGYLDLLMASPECTFFSRARGGKPIHDQSRMSAWHVQRWASTLDIRCILVENVAEFTTWGPLLPSGRPDPAKKGVYFEAWIQALWGMGYTVQWRLLNAADYGDATTRVRFFLQARKDGNLIRWPEPSHAPAGSGEMFGSRPRWRAARDIIDWQNPGKSLLTRKKPLSEKTRRRIARGLEKFGGPLAPLYISLLDLEPGEVTGKGHGEPFIYANRNHSAPRSTDEPLPTIVGAEWGIGFVNPTVEPFVLGQQSGSAARSTGEPIPTVSTDGAIALVEPMVTNYYGTGITHSVDEPLPTITTRDRFGLCSPLIVPVVHGEKNGQVRAPHSSDDPLPAITTKRCFGLAEPTVEPFVLSRFGNETVRPVDEPLPTVVGRGAGYLVEPFIVPQFGERQGQAPRVHDVRQPCPAVTSHGAGALVNPTLVQIDQSGRQGESVRSIDEPLPTMTQKQSLGVAEPIVIPCEDPDKVDRRRLVVIDGVLCVLDIRFRMLSNRELARAMGFDDDAVYEFTGNAGEVTKQIGNAVAVNTAAALVRAVLEAG